MFPLHSPRGRVLGLPLLYRPPRIPNGCRMRVSSKEIQDSYVRLRMPMINIDGMFMLRVLKGTRAKSFPSQPRTGRRRYSRDA
jgi:hypothetical protein